MRRAVLMLSTTLLLALAACQGMQAARPVPAPVPEVNGGGGNGGGGGGGGGGGNSSGY